MKKKFLCTTLTFILLTLSGCGSTDDAVTSNPDTEIKTVEESSTTVETQESLQTDTNTENPQVSIDEQIVYDYDGIKITATNLDFSSFMGPELTFLIENNSDKNITIQARNVSVNGYMVDSTMSAEVMSQKKSNDSLTFSSNSFDECGIDQIAEIEFNFHIFDSESWEDFADSDTILIQTSCFNGYIQKYDDSGDVLYEDSNIKIISKGLSEENIMGPSLMLYIENNSDNGLTVQSKNTSINGFMIDATLSPEIAAGKKAIASMTFFDSDIKENGIENIENMETSFHIFYTDGWETLIDTDAINISF